MGTRYQHLSAEERATIMIMLQQGCSGLYAVLCGNASRHVGIAGANGLAGRCLSLDMRR